LAAQALIFPEKAWRTRAAFSKPRQYFRPSARICKSSPQADQARPQPVPDVFGKNQERQMKFSLFPRIITAMLALAFTTSAFCASETHKADFQLSEAAQVNGQLLPAGEYTARWEGSGPSVQVSIMQGKTVIVTVPAQVVALNQAANDTQAEIKNSENGDRTLTALRFSGKTYSLTL